MPEFVRKLFYFNLTKIICMSALAAVAGNMAFAADRGIEAGVGSLKHNHALQAKSEFSFPISVNRKRRNSVIIQNGNNSRQESELVIIVTPTLTTPRRATCPNPEDYAPGC